MKRGQLVPSLELLSWLPRAWWESKIELRCLPPNETSCSVVRHGAADGLFLASNFRSLYANLPAYVKPNPNAYAGTTSGWAAYQRYPTRPSAGMTPKLHERTQAVLGRPSLKHTFDGVIALATVYTNVIIA